VTSGYFLAWNFDILQVFGCSMRRKMGQDFCVRVHFGVIASSRLDFVFRIRLVAIIAF
jgi:hypothetical protein